MAAAFLKGVGGRVVDTAGEAADKVGDVAGALKEQATAFAEEKAAMLKQFEHEKKMLIAQKLKSGLDGVFDFAMDEFAFHIKDAFDDPYRPQWAKTWINDLIDSLWPDVKEEFKDVILSGIAGVPGIEHGEPFCCCPGPMAWIRYTLYPYDRNFWRLIRNPFWWLFKLLFIFPRYGVSQVAYGIWFFFLDKGDEYQLQEFIVMFKALQFASLGILSAFIGCVMYFFCTNMDNCEQYAPQESAFTVAMFVLQIILVWLAFALMQCSSKKGGGFYQLEQRKKREGRGRSEAERMQKLHEIAIGDVIRDQEHHEANDEAKARSRGRLLKFLIYDFVVFLICAGLVIWMALANLVSSDSTLDKNNDIGIFDDGGTNWQFKSGLYMIKAFYGLMSFPFVLLLIPGLSTLLSHARPTGYNPWGNVVPYLGHEEEQPTPWRNYPIDKKTGKRVDPILPI